MRSRRDRREGHRRSGGGEVGTVVFADGVDVEPDLLGAHGLVDHLAQPFAVVVDGSRTGGWDRLGERRQTEFHPVSVSAVPTPSNDSTRSHVRYGANVDDITLDAYLADARSRLDRVAPLELDHAIEEGAVVVDIRPSELRTLHGDLPGAMIIGLDVLEWRLAPSSPTRVIDIAEGRRVILVCQQGYSSSLAAARLRDLGIAGATDLVGGYEAWSATQSSSG